MKKIIFKDRPDRSTPLSAKNLNEMQDNIEVAVIAAKTKSQVIEGTLPSQTGWQNIKNFTIDNSLVGTRPFVASFRYRNNNGIWLNIENSAAGTQQNDSSSVISIQLNGASFAGIQFQILLISGGGS